MSIELPTSPVLFANLIREHVPPAFHVVAIGGNMTPGARVEVHAARLTLTFRWNGDAWVHDQPDGSVRELLRLQSVVALLHETCSGEYS